MQMASSYCGKKHAFRLFFPGYDGEVEHNALGCGLVGQRQQTQDAATESHWSEQQLFVPYRSEAWRPRDFSLLPATGYAIFTVLIKNLRYYENELSQIIVGGAHASWTN
jgi:hypothetical protein